MREVYVSTLCLGRDWVAKTRQSGTLPEGMRLELGGGVGRDDAIWLLDQAHAAKGRSSFLIHNYFPPAADPFVINLASSSRKIRDRSVAFCKAAMASTATLGAPFYSVHSGLALDPTPEQLGNPIPVRAARPLDQALNTFRESVEELAMEARRLGVQLLLENHVLAGFNAPEGRNTLLLFCDLDDFRSFDTCFPWSEVGILLDVGHLKVSARTLGFDPKAAVMAASHRIRAVHLHDNDGVMDRHLSFDEHAWFMDLLRYLPPDAVLILESGRASPEDIARMISYLTQTALTS